MAAEGNTADEMARDASQARRLLDNAQVCLWDIDQDQLTARERRRLGTINRKIGELTDIIEEREIEQYE